MESDHPISNIVRVSMYNTQLPNHMPTRSSSCYPTIKGSRLCYVGRFVQDKLPKLSFSSRFHVTNVHVLRNENPRSNLMYIYVFIDVDEVNMSQFDSRIEMVVQKIMNYTK